MNHYKGWCLKMLISVLPLVFMSKSHSIDKHGYHGFAFSSLHGRLFDQFVVANHYDTIHSLFVYRLCSSYHQVLKL